MDKHRRYGTGYVVHPSGLFLHTTPLPQPSFHVLNEIERIGSDERNNGTKRSQVRIAMDFTDGLQYLHQHDIIHRDIKTPNVLIDSSWRAKLCDYNFAIDEKSSIKQVLIPWLLWCKLDMQGLLLEAFVSCGSICHAFASINQVGVLIASKHYVLQG